jgi:cystathionine beta-lyase/cystathionine gamma-synthase
LERITKTTETVLNFLKNHPQVEDVIFPFDKSFAQYELAKQQMTGGLGLLTFIVKAKSVEQIELFCNQLQHILMAVSWGGYESLIIPKCAGIKREEFDTNNKWHRSLRLYVGLEEPEYIVNDLKTAFAGI